MGGFPSKKKQLEKERLEAERQAMIRHRLAIFNNPDSLKPKEEEDTDSEDWNIVEKREKEAELLKSKPKKDPQQMELTENNIKINERKLSAENAAFLAKNLDGPSSILDGKMMKVLEFMLNPEFDKASIIFCICG
jgi:P pilus assembly chaperone PapD